MSEKVRKRREENMCEEIVYSFPSWAVDQRSARKAVFPKGVGRGTWDSPWLAKRGRGRKVKKIGKRVIYSESSKGSHPFC